MGCFAYVLIIGHWEGSGSSSVPLPQLSPDLRPTLVVCFTDSAFLQHIVANVAEDLKLLLTGQSVGTVTF